LTRDNVETKRVEKTPSQGERALRDYQEIAAEKLEHASSSFASEASARFSWEASVFLRVLHRSLPQSSQNHKVHVPFNDSCFFEIGVN